MLEEKCPNCGSINTEQDTGGKGTTCLGGIALVLALIVGFNTHWILGIVVFGAIIFIWIKLVGTKHRCNSCRYVWRIK